MIIEGAAAGAVGYWAAHLTKEMANSPDPNTNDRVTVIEISGLLSNTLEGALREMQAVASGSRSEGNFMYQANINTLAHEKLTPEQWKQSVDALEKELGLEGHQRVVVEHEKHGRVHQHVIWNRVDVDTLRVVDIGGDRYAHQRTADKLEDKFGLEKAPHPLLDFNREARTAAKSPQLWELRAAQRSGIDNDQLKAELTDLWRKTDSGKAFAAAVEERGYILAQGDRRNFCIVDQAGTAHSLARRIEGAKAKDINERLADIDRDKLPRVEAARETQREKYPTKEAAREAWHSRTGAADHAKQPEPERAQPEKRIHRTADDIRATWSQSPDGAAFAAAMRDQGYRLARVTPEEARQSERADAFAKEVGNFVPKYREDEIIVVNERGRVYRLDPKTTGAADREAVEKFISGIDRADLPGVMEARAAQSADRERQDAIYKKQRWQDRDQTKTEKKVLQMMAAADRGGASVSAGLYEEGLTVARVDAKGKADIEAEYVRRFENDKLKDIREGTRTARLRRTTFEEGELVAVTKWGEVHRLNPLFIDTEKLERAVTGGSDKTPSLSDAREHFATARQQQKDERTRAFETRQEGRAEERGYDRTVNAFKRALPEAASKFVDAGLKGLDGAGKIASLGSFVESLLGMGAARPPMSEAQQQQRALEALENIEESIQRGDRLSPSDVANLLPTQLDNLKLHGNDYMLEMIKDLERDRQREQERGYGRELER